MSQKIEWLLDLWRREWKRCKKDWLRLVYIEVLTVAVVCVVFILRRAQLDRFVEYTLNMPAAIYAFWGITSGVVTGKASFYIQWVLMPMHVWIAWKVCDDMIRSLWMEEESGNIFYLCNQWYSRQQIFLAKYLWNVVKFIVGYVVLFAVSAVLAGNGWGLGRLIGLFVKGVLVMTLLLSLSSCYAVIGKRKDRVLWTEFLIFGTLAIGNLYKLKDLLVLLLQRADRGYAGLYRATGWLQGLRWLSPLSWLNAYTRFGAAGTALQVAICVVGIAVSVFWGLTRYQTRNFGEFGKV